MGNVLVLWGVDVRLKWINRDDKNLRKGNGGWEEGLCPTQTLCAIQKDIRNNDIKGANTQTL